MKAGFRWVLLSVAVLACGKAEPPIETPVEEQHAPPEIIEASQSATSIKPGGSVTMRVSARDPEGSELRFSWKTDQGTLGTPATLATSSEVVWTAPLCTAESQPTNIQLTVSNAWNRSIARVFSVTLSPTCLVVSSTASMSTPRWFHAASVLPSGKVLVTGGGNVQQSALASAEVYDPVAASWTPAAPMSVSRGGHTATVLPSGQVLVAGGGSDSAVLSSAELYEPATDSWAPTGSMSTPRQGHTASVLPSGKVLVVGGGDSSGIRLASAEVYDPATGAWKSTGSMSAPRTGHTASVLPSGKVLIAGGVGSGPRLASAEIYDPATGVWTPAGTMSSPRTGHTASVMSSGKVLIAGGEGSGPRLISAEVYDPATGAWTLTASMVRSRADHAAIVLPSGPVMVVGGVGASDVPNQVPGVELYEPLKGTWHEVTQLNEARRYVVASQLPSGGVLITGGSGSHGILSSVELLGVP